MPSVVVGTYPTAEQVMRLARAIVNDMLRTRDGFTLANQKPYTIEYLNAAIEDVQEFLANNGITSNVKDNVILTPLTAVPTISPATQVYVGIDGYNDGTTLHATPKLPVDLILPLKAWERQTDSNGQFLEMNQPQDGLPSRNQGPNFGLWEWREDRIYLIGATSSRDIRVKYEASLATIADTSDFATTVIPIRGGKRALAFGVAEYYAIARGAPQQALAAEKKLENMQQLVNRQVRKDQRIAFRCRGYRDRSNTIDGSLGGSYR